MPEDARIIHVTLDEASLGSRTPEAEHERAVAIYDLLQANRFAPAGLDGGPYILHLAIEDTNRLVFDIRDQEGWPLDRMSLSLTPFRRFIRDYMAICDSYYDAIKRATPSRIEAIDMARRGLHDEGSRLLIERLAGKVCVDFDTARRLFTLVCVLHLKR